MSATEEQILAGARAMCSLNAIRQFQRVDYDGLDVREREHWEDLARVCLTVALAPAQPRSVPLDTLQACTCTRTMLQAAHEPSCPLASEEL